MLLLLGFVGNSCRTVWKRLTMMILSIETCGNITCHGIRRGGRRSSNDVDGGKECKKIPMFYRDLIYHRNLVYYSAYGINISKFV